MTGFQPHPGTGIKITGEEGTKVQLESLIKGAGITEDHLWIVDSNDLEQTTGAIEEAINAKGPRVIISRHACVLYEKSVQKDKKYNTVRIDSNKCNNCMICIKNFGCPALTLVDNNVVVIERNCNGCEVCIKICPFGAIEVNK
jgi:indolepyruvate ferredoxin oxidoreductase alpha subunit